MTSFPVHLHHQNTGGTTTAATPSSLRALEARGWRQGQPDNDPSPDQGTSAPSEPSDGEEPQED